MYDPTKPSMVILRSLPRTGSHFATGMITEWLKSKYDTDEISAIYPMEFFELNGRTKHSGHVERMADGSIMETGEPAIDDEQAHRRRLIIGLLNDARSFAFKTFAGNKETEHLVQFFERYATERGYNVIKIDLFRCDILSYYASRIYAQQNQKWVYFADEEYTPVETTAPDHMISKWAIEFHILFDILRYYNDPNHWEYTITYEELVEEGPGSLIHLWDADADTSEYTAFVEKTPIDYASVITNYDTIRERFSDVLDLYNVSHNNFVIDPTLCPFTIDVDIPGWTSWNKLFALSKYAYKVPESLAILECGSFVGRSSYALGMNKKAKVPLYCMDWFPDGRKKLGQYGEHTLGAQEHMDKYYSFQTFLEFMRKVPEMYPFRGDLFKRLESVPDKSIYLAFADAGHGYDDTLATLNAIKPKLDPEYAILAIDDYNDKAWPDSKRAIDDFIEANPPFATEFCPGDETMIILRYRQ